jgi:hypothetical protein
MAMLEPSEVRYAKGEIGCKPEFGTYFVLGINCDCFALEFDTKFTTFGITRKANITDD